MLGATGESVQFFLTRVFFVLFWFCRFVCCDVSVDFVGAWDFSISIDVIYYFVGCNSNALFSSAADSC